MIEVAFPKGAPATDEEKSKLTEWSEKQEELLGAAASDFRKNKPVV